MLYAWVWLDASSAPNGVMLQWNENGSWNHRAYWGANAIPWGTNGTSTLRNKGGIPASGQWVKLEATADEVGLVGKTIKGMAFTLNNGHVWWDKAGVKKASYVGTKYYSLGGQRVAMRDNTGLYFLHGDHLGSASMTTNASGVKVGEMRYTPFGDQRAMVNQFQSDRRYTGMASQNSLGGVYDYGARMYSSLLGRFLSPDSLVPHPSDPQSLNRYSHTRNNPISRIDSDGHADRDPTKDFLCKFVITCLPEPQLTPNGGGEQLNAKDDTVEVIATPGGLVVSKSSGKGVTQKVTNVIKSIAIKICSGILAIVCGDAARRAAEKMADAANRDGDGGATEVNTAIGIAEKAVSTIGGKVGTVQGSGAKVVIEGAARGGRNITIRIMNSGGIRDNPYIRVSIDGLGSFTKDGKLSNDPALTHHAVDFINDPEAALELIRNLTQFAQNYKK